MIGNGRITIECPEQERVKDIIEQQIIEHIKNNATQRRTIPDREWQSSRICQVRNKNKSTKKVRVCCSGGFDTIHPGHISYIEEAIKLGDELLIILTRDDQLLVKKNMKPIPYEVRRAVLEWGLNGRGKVVENIDRDITSKESLRYYRPNIFAKGGDTWDIENLPEKEVCQELGIKVVFGVGGYEKMWNSSKLC